MSRSEVQDRGQLEARLNDLETEHRALDDAIHSLSGSSGFDQLRLRRLKKRKLALKDQIAFLRSRLLPDIIA